MRAWRRRRVGSTSPPWRAAIHEKLIRRHPHVFEDAGLAADVGQLSRIWEEHKARERAQAAGDAVTADHSALADVPRALPALTRAAKLGRRAARVGFDWEHPSQVRDKVLEEVREIDDELAAGADSSSASLAEEIGDLLFAAANWALHLKIDPEEALRAANAKFERRFRRMEALAAARGSPLQTLDAAQWDVLWRQAKREVWKPRPRSRFSVDSPSRGYPFQAMKAMRSSVIGAVVLALAAGSLIGRAQAHPRYLE